MFGACKKAGFTLLELLVAIAILALLATVLVPNFSRLQPGYERGQFIGRLNALLLYARQSAINTYTLHQMLFDFSNNSVQVLASTGKKDKKGETEFKPIPGGYLTSSVSLPDWVEIKNIFIDSSGVDEMAQFVGRKAGQIWFYIVPEGLAQEVIVNFYDTHDQLSDGKARPIGLVLNPFMVQFKEYDSFQK